MRVGGQEGSAGATLDCWPREIDGDSFMLIRPVLLLLTVLMCVVASGQAATGPKELAEKLNTHRSVQGSDEEKAWPVLVEYLQSLPPMPDGAMAPINEIWPGMDGWPQAAAWASQQDGLAEAVSDASGRLKLGLAYGRSAVAPESLSAGLFIDLGQDDVVARPKFPYLKAFDRLAQWIAVESNRLIEEGKVEEGVDLLIDGIFIMRLVSDREFLDEKSWGMQRLIDLLEVLRDVMYRNTDNISAELLNRISLKDMPAIRPDRARLFIPEHDRLVCQVFLENAFHEVHGGDSRDFPRIYTDLQARSEPLSRFGARRRWESLYEGHDSLKSSLERLDHVYDDWWRRWRVNPQSAMGKVILAELSQFETINPARFAAMLVAIRDMQGLFELRDDLVFEVNAAATSAGLAGYLVDRGVYPHEMRMTYGISTSKVFDQDIHDPDFSAFKYRVRDQRNPVDVGTIRVWIEPDTGLLYSVGRDGFDGIGERHLAVDSDGDLIIWPPPDTLVRLQSASSPEK
jgi:hypothetical protein